jgi:ribosomal protein S18 acetylase RimI-like enzyme
MSHDQIQHLERLSCRAWPGIDETSFGGWLAQRAAGYTRRCNSVHAFAEPGMELRAAVMQAEAFYTPAGLVPRFKLTDASQPPSLEQLLPEIGYVADEGALVMTGRISNSGATPGDVALNGDHDGLRLYTTPTANWLSAYLSVGEIATKHHDAAAQVVHNIRRPAAFAVALDNASIPAAVGLAVEEDGWIGMFGIVTRPDQRRRGLGKRMVRRLLAWGVSVGASNAYLQVMHANEPAQLLYRQLGFAPVYEYRYWRKQ